MWLTLMAGYCSNREKKKFQRILRETDGKVK